ncbi:MAG: c-type cytochrome [Nitrospira sp.]|nr:c-type cytochrome [bacterium]MBL7048300.1 c-type cytochrome [Nitrospira sp.]
MYIRKFTISILFIAVVFFMLAMAPAPQVVKTDRDSIMRGKKIFAQKCSRCHDPLSYEYIKGPGLKKVMKKANLPVSGRAATPANIARQLSSAYRDMPSFRDLLPEEVTSIIAYLNTL